MKLTEKLNSWAYAVALSDIIYHKHLSTYFYSIIYLQSGFQFIYNFKTTLNLSDCRNSNVNWYINQIHDVFCCPQKNKIND